MESTTAAVLHGVMAAQRAPHRKSYLDPDSWDDATVLRAVCGSTPPAALVDEPRVAEKLVRQWRADYRSIDVFANCPIRPVRTPLDVLTGRGDPSTQDEGDVTGWAQWTSGETTFEVIDGGHDFLFTAASRVAERLRSVVNYSEVLA